MHFVLSLCLWLAGVWTTNACTDRRDYKYEFRNEWKQNGVYKSNGVISPIFKGTLVNWKIKIVFTAPLVENLEVYDVRAQGRTLGKSTIVLLPKFYNKERKATDWFSISYIVAFRKRQGRKHYKCIEICGTIKETGKRLCSDKTTSRKECSSENFKTLSFLPSLGSYEASVFATVPTDTVGWKVAFELADPCDVITTDVAQEKQGDFVILYDSTEKLHAGQKLVIEYSCHFTKTTQKAQVLSLAFLSGDKINVTICGTPLPATSKPTSAATTTTQTTRTTQTKLKTTATKLTLPSTTMTTTTKTTTKTTMRTSSTTTATNKNKTTPQASTSTATAKSSTTLKSCNPKYAYSEVLQKSMLFYEAQRSGRLPSDQRVKWRKNSALTDGQDVGKDLTGGYYDAGDYIKFGFPMASTVTLLAWGMIEFPEGYERNGQVKYGLKTLKWATDYFIKCHTGKYEFYAQVGDPNLDHNYWGRPEEMTMKRPSFKIDAAKPGSEVAAETAAALAATSMVFRYHGDTKYADQLLKHAVDLEAFGTKYRKSYHESIPEAKDFYKSYNGFEDELAWAQLWLYRASSNKLYYEAFSKEFEETTLTGNVTEFSWDDKWAGVKVLAAVINKNDKFLTKLKELLQKPKKTTKGLFFISEYGSNRHAANLAFLALAASRVSSAEFYESFAREQIHYLLGDTGRSFVVGFGKNPPLKPYHASSSCPDTGKCDWDNFWNEKIVNPQILYGALVGGPNKEDWYQDVRRDYIRNEVACDYNAGFQSAIAGLIELSDHGKC